MKLDHVTICAADLDATRDFLVDVLGLRVGERPDFSFPGYWLYLGDSPIIHMMGRDPGSDEASTWVDHVAFGPFDFDAKRQELEAIGRAFKVADVPGAALRQIFVEGPGGVRLELQCPTRRAPDR